MIARLSLVFGVLAALFAPSPLRAEQPVLPLALPSLERSPVSGHLRILSATDAEMIEPLLQGFRRRYPDITVEYVEYDQSQDLNRDVQTACRQHMPLADLIINSAIDLQVKLVNGGCAQRQSLRAVLPEWARWRDELYGLTYEPVVIAYRKSAFPAGNPPRSRFEMLDLMRHDPALYYGRVGTYDIRSSGAGYLFMTLDATQASTFGRMMESLARSQARLVCCSAQVLDGLQDGSLSLGYNILGAYALDRQRKGGSEIGIIFPEDYTLVFTRTAFVYKFASNPAAAAAFIDFALSDEGRRISREETTLLNPIDGEPALRVLYGLAPDAPLRLRPIEISPALLLGQDQQKRRHLLKEWLAALHEIASEGPGEGQ